MSRRRTAPSSPWLPWLSLWLALGTLTLCLTPLSAWTPLMGWAPALWLVVTPLLLLLVIDPWLPLRLLVAWRRRRFYRAGLFTRHGYRCAVVPCGARTRA